MVSHLQKLPTVETTGTLEPVAHFDGAMPTGVTVSHQGRIFVNFPKWGDEVEFTVAELRDGKFVAYPNQAFNQTQSDNLAAALVSVQSVVIDQVLEPGIRVTVAMGAERNLDSGKKLSLLQINAIINNCLILFFRSCFDQ